MSRNTTLFYFTDCLLEYNYFARYKKELTNYLDSGSKYKSTATTEFQSQIKSLWMLKLVDEFGIFAAVKRLFGWPECSGYLGERDLIKACITGVSHIMEQLRCAFYLYLLGILVCIVDLEHGIHWALCSWIMLGRQWVGLHNTAKPNI